ncbi:hypothetical protein ACPV3O_21385 [Vibrio rotiferianus]|uniref:hypothetical protein n=1 Tax=Vibrio rotiferianus TaxID=190895 RepID=UPI00406A5D82
MGNTISFVFMVVIFMGISVVTSYLCGKSSQQDECEDGLYFDDNFICVIDGATNKGTMLYNGLKPGVAIKNLILSLLPTIPKEICAVDFFETINKEVRAIHANVLYASSLKEHPENKLTASIAIYSTYRNELWSVGDCKYIINDTVYENEKKIDLLLSEVRSLVFQIETESNSNEVNTLRSDIGREFILPLLEKQHQLQNKSGEYTFNVVDGTDLSNNQIDVITLIHLPQKVVLSTDGYPRLFDTLEESEKYLSDVISTDPMMINKAKSTKGIAQGNSSFDDRAYISFVVN